MQQQQQQQLQQQLQQQQKQQQQLDSILTPAAAAVAASQPSQYAADSPSLLGSPYLASQGGQVLVVGATKQHDWTAQQALRELGRVICPSILQQQRHKLEQQQLLSAGAGEDERQALAAAAAEAAEVAAAAAELLAGAAAAWPPISGWKISGIRTGVRALPPRTQQGSVPLAGRWTDSKQEDR
jgi:hypothetical protein